jgi:hypothetical protein
MPTIKPTIKNYILALASQVPPAFRRGVIAVTALAYILLTGAYVFGALVIAVAEVLVVLPPLRRRR